MELVESERKERKTMKKECVRKLRGGNFTIPDTLFGSFYLLLPLKPNEGVENFSIFQFFNFPIFSFLSLSSKQMEQDFCSGFNGDPACGRCDWSNRIRRGARGHLSYQRTELLLKKTNLSNPILRITIVHTQDMHPLAHK